MSDCQIFDGRKASTGYGVVMLGGKQVLAHRIAFAIYYGKDPSGLVVRHACDNPPCVNPEHLSVGTHAENMADKKKSGVVAGENNPASKLLLREVQEIRAMISCGISGVNIARRFGVTPTLISYIKNGKKWNTHKKDSEQDA